MAIGFETGKAALALNPGSAFRFHIGNPLFSVAPLLQHWIHLAQSKAVVRSRSRHHEVFVWSRVFNRESLIFSGHSLFVVRDDYLLVKTAIGCVPHPRA